MNPKIEINSLSISKSKSEQNSFVKYDIEASLDEVENIENEMKLKYGFAILSNPKNTRISVDGYASIYGDQLTVSNYLSQDENNIPRIVNNIYQELFPLFYVLTKSMHMPCPAYKLSQISAPNSNQPVTIPEQVENRSMESEDNHSQASEPDVNSKMLTEEEIEVKLEQAQEKIVSEPTVSPI